LNFEDKKEKKREIQHFLKFPAFIVDAILKIFAFVVLIFFEVRHRQKLSWYIKEQESV